MPDDRIDRWLDTATAKIPGARRRQAVHAELECHIRDRVRLLTAHGVPEDTAVASVLRRMGDPQVLAAQLAEPFRPLRRFLGWLLILLLWAAAAYLLLRIWM